jgi:hypothetical protein
VSLDQHLADRVVEVGPNRFEQDPEQQDDQVQVDQGADQELEGWCRPAHQSAPSSRPRRTAASIARSIMAAKSSVARLLRAASVVPPGEVTRRRKFGALELRAGQHQAGAVGGLAGQAGGGFGRQAGLFAGRGQLFGQGEEIGRSRAGHGGDRIHQVFVVDPDRFTGRAHDGFGQAFILIGGGRTGHHAGHAGAVQGRRIGHGANQRAFARPGPGPGRRG